MSSTLAVVVDKPLSPTTARDNCLIRSPLPSHTSSRMFITEAIGSVNNHYHRDSPALPSEANVSPVVTISHLPEVHFDRPSAGTPRLNCPLQSVNVCDASEFSQTQIGRATPSISPGAEHMKRRCASAFFAYFTLGWGDGVTGTLLPYFQKDLHLNFMTSSLLFVASAVGFAVGTLLIERITRLLGHFYLSSQRRPLFPAIPALRRSKKLSFDTESLTTGFSASQSRCITLFLASLLHAAFFVIMGSESGFASMLIAYAISSFARSFITTSLNVYVSTTPKRALGYVYGYWAVGAFAAPLVCQSIIATGVPWTRFYFGSLVLPVINTSFLLFAFHTTRNEFQKDLEFAWNKHNSSEATPNRSGSITPRTDASCPSLSHVVDEKNTISQALIEYEVEPINALRRAIVTPRVWAFAWFAGLYTGTESSTQGYIVLYLLSTRNADPKTVGYVTSGFWGGMAIARLAWGYGSSSLSFTQRKYLIHICIAIAFVMHILIWFVHSMVENAFSTAVIGMVYGPIFPGNLEQANEIISADLRMVTMAIMSACASCGAALFPFITGTLSNYKGPHILPYVTVAQTATMFCIWCFYPSKKPIAT